MSDELSPAARALLDNARGGLGPDAAAIARMRAQIGAGIAAGAASTTTSSGLSLGAKLSVLGVVAAVAIGGYLASRPDAAAPGPVASRPAPVAVAPVSPPVEAAPAPLEPEAIEAIEMPPTVVGKRARPVVSRPTTTTVELAREVELIDRAMAALKRADASAALAAVADHAHETAGKGQLAEDAAAIEIEALCRLRQPVATKLDAFDTRWPTSAQRARLTASCPE